MRPANAFAPIGPRGGRLGRFSPRRRTQPDRPGTPSAPGPSRTAPGPQPDPALPAAPDPSRTAPAGPPRTPRRPREPPPRTRIPPRPHLMNAIDVLYRL